MAQLRRHLDTLRAHGSELPPGRWPHKETSGSWSLRLQSGDVIRYRVDREFVRLFDAARKDLPRFIGTCERLAERAEGVEDLDRESSELRQRHEAVAAALARALEMLGKLRGD